MDKQCQYLLCSSKVRIYRVRWRECWHSSSYQIQQHKTIMKSKWRQIQTRQYFKLKTTALALRGHTTVQWLNKEGESLAFSPRSYVLWVIGLFQQLSAGIQRQWKKKCWKNDLFQPFIPFWVFVHIHICYVSQTNQLNNTSSCIDFSLKLMNNLIVIRIRNESEIWEKNCNKSRSKEQRLLGSLKTAPLIHK